MATAPMMPSEDGNLADQAAANVDERAPSERDSKPGVPPRQRGEASGKVNESAQFGSLSQNQTAIRNVRDR